MAAVISFPARRMPTPRGLELIERWETCSLVPYVCPAGYATIGVGAIFGLDGRRVTLQHRAITRAEAVALLKRDVTGAAEAVLRLCPGPLKDGQFDALVSFTFNLGGGALQASTLRRCVNRGDHAEVYDALRENGEFGRWIFAKGRALRGLRLRRAEEARLYRGE